MITRPSGRDRVPIVLAVDGSLCIPSRAGSYIQGLLPEASGLKAYALVTVEKPEPTPLPPRGEDGSYRIGPEHRCSDAFKRYYSIDQRVLDHLRAIQHLRTHAPWWDGRLYLWGFSDGGRVASVVGAYTPETARMVLGGFGGGSTMAREFEDFHICAEGRTENRTGCLDEVRRQLSEIRDNPTPLKTWNGDSNTYKAWASRLDASEANVLEDTRIPILVFHGEKDTAVPVASARLLAERMARQNPRFVYREIAGMGHGLGSNLPEDKARTLQRELLEWLLAPETEN